MKFEGLRQWKARALERSGGRGRELAFLLEQPEGENDIVFDLHIHDINSDGAREERKVFAEAQENYVKIISQTNHDTMNSVFNYHTFMSDTADYTGGYVNGIEASCRLGGYPVECLIYGFNEVKARHLINTMQFPYFNRSFKIKRILSLMKQRLSVANKLGITPKFLDLNDFIAVEQTGPNGETKYVPLKRLGLDSSRDIGESKDKVNEEVVVNGETCKVNFDYFNSKLFKYIIQSPEGREFLAQKGIEVSEYDATTVDIESLEIPKLLGQAYAKFNRTIIQNKESALFVDDSEWWPTFEQVAEFAKITGGVAVLAHPYGYSGVSAEPEVLMEMAVESGADGIECLHGFNNPQEVEKIYNFCKERGLFITAGSDTHGFYSYQGNKTQIGIAPGTGEDYHNKNNPIHEMPISTFNVHYIGSGAYRKNKNRNIETEMGM